MIELTKLSKSAAILIADDLPEMRAMIGDTFHMLGYDQIVEARNGEDALAKTRLNTFGLAIIDLNMPKINGINLIKKIRENRLHKDMPIFVVTAHSEQELVLEAIKAGATDFIAKPFTSDILIDKLEKTFA